MVDPDERLVVDPGERLREVDPDEQRAGETRPVGDGDRVDVAHRDAGVGQRLVEDRHDPAEMGAGRDLGDDPAGRGVERDLAGDDVGVDPAAALDDARSPVSSHDDLDGEDERAAHGAASRRRRLVARSAGVVRPVGAGLRPALPGAARSASRIARLAERLRRHDQRVLVVVAVVARPEADRPEAVLLVEPAGREVRQPDLERRLARVPVDGEVEEREEQPLADPLAAPGRVDRERRDVGLVDHQPHPAVGHDRARRPGRPGTSRGGSSRARCGRRAAATAREARLLDRWTASRSSSRIALDRSFTGGRATMRPPRVVGRGPRAAA